MAAQRRQVSSRRLGRPPAADSAATRKRIITVARGLFARFGYEATTNKDIAREAGLSPGLLYHYFDSKVDLYIEVHEDCSTYIYDRFHVVASDCSDLVDALCAIADDAVALHAEDPTLASFISSAVADAPRYPEVAINYLLG